MNIFHHPRVGGGDELQPLLFQDLPSDVLIAIFRFCNVPSLLRLSQTCKRINNIINEVVIWLERSKRVNVCNQVSTEVKSRSFSILTCKDRCRISHNWNTGYYQEKIYLNNYFKFMPWLQLEKDVLWFSQGRLILALKRGAHSISSSSTITLKSYNEDVSRFVVKNGRVVSGGRDGSLLVWNLNGNKLFLEEKRAHNLDITDVDYDGFKTIVTGSKDKSIQVWNLKDENIEQKSHMVTEDQVVWSVKFRSCSNAMLCYGTSGHTPSKCPLVLYDIERDQKTHLNHCYLKSGAGVSDILWEDPNTVITCGYDSMVRMWDIRALTCVQYLSDPFDAALYSLASDFNNTLLCGTAQYGRVLMMDKRSFRAKQMYFMNSKHSSPAYSLAFDAAHLFVALDQSLNMMDFSGLRYRLSNVARDYRNFAGC